jgi:hypothetical protein
MGGIISVSDDHVSESTESKEMANMYSMGQHLKCIQGDRVISETYDI